MKEKEEENMIPIIKKGLGFSWPLWVLPLIVVAVVSVLIVVVLSGRKELGSFVLGLLGIKEEEESGS